MLKMLARMKRAIVGDDTAPRYGMEMREVPPDHEREFALKPKQISRLGELVECLASGLGPERAASLAQRAMQSADGVEDEAMAFAAATSIEVDCALSLNLDWGSSDSVEWAINRVLETLEVAERWQWNPDVADRSMPATFKTLEAWLTLRGFHVWHVKTNGDDALLFPVRQQQAEQAARLARAFGLELFTLADSERFYGSVA